MIYDSITFYDSCDQLKELLRELFNDKVDKTGKPYFEHLEHVGDKAAMLGSQWGFDRRLCYIVGLCHDCYEDLTAEQIDQVDSLIEQLWYEHSEQIKKYIQLLTHDRSVQYKDYLQRIIDDMSVATVVKCADLYHNSDISRYPISMLDETVHSRCAMYYKRYLKVIKALKAHCR